MFSAIVTHQSSISIGLGTAHCLMFLCGNPLSSNETEIAVLECYKVTSDMYQCRPEDAVQCQQKRNVLKDPL